MTPKKQGRPGTPKELADTLFGNASARGSAAADAAGEAVNAIKQGDLQKAKAAARKAADAAQEDDIRGMAHNLDAAIEDER